MRLTSTTRSHSAVEISSILVGRRTPALFTRMSTLPNLATVAATSSSDGGLVGHVAAPAHGAAPVGVDLGRGPLDLIAVQVTEHDAGAVLGQGPGDMGSHSPGGAGDDGRRGQWAAGH